MSTISCQYDKQLQQLTSKQLINYRPTDISDTDIWYVFAIVKVILGLISIEFGLGKFYENLVHYS